MEEGQCQEKQKDHVTTPCVQNSLEKHIAKNIESKEEENQTNIDYRHHNEDMIQDGGKLDSCI